MARSGQLLVNPDATVAPVAPWVNLANVMIQGFGGSTFDHGAHPSFAVQNLGAYHFIQDVAIPPANIAAVDAGMLAVDYSTYGAIVAHTPASTLTMYLEARDGGGTVLQTWSQLATAFIGTWPWTQFVVNLRSVPPLTRTLRVGFQGTNNFANSGWFSGTGATGLYIQDAGLVASKFLGYGVLGPRPGVSATKYIAYAIIGPPPPEEPTEGLPPEIVPDEDCEDETGGVGCCVPDLNRVIEARVGVLNTHHDLVVAIQYLQDRYNVLVREFNKLALVTRSNPPSV